MNQRWVSPGCEDLVAFVEESIGFPDPTMEDCSQCGGTGRHTIQDSDGSLKSVTCMACQGSGQKPEQ